MNKNKNTAGTSLMEAIKLSIRGYKLWWDKYPAMFTSTAVCAAVSALTPYVGIYLSAQIINEIAGERDASTLTRLVLAALM